MKQEWTKNTVVTITTYHRPVALRDTIESIRDLFPQVMIFVGDNGFSRAKVAGPNVQYIELPVDFGLSASRNYLVDEAHRQGYEYVLVSDDDFLFSEKSDIQKLYDLMDECHIASGHMRREHRPLCASRFYKEGDELVHHMSQAKGDGPQRMDFAGTLILARTATLRHCRFDDRLKVGEHQDFYMRAYHLGLRILLVPGVEVQDGGDEAIDGRGDPSYLAARNRARMLNLQALTRWQPYLGSVLFRSDKHGDHGVQAAVELPRIPHIVRDVAVSDENAPVTPSLPEGWQYQCALLYDVERLLWPCHKHIWAMVPEKTRAGIALLLLTYRSGGVCLNQTALASGTILGGIESCGVHIEAFFCTAGFGAVAGHPWLGEWLRMLPESIGRESTMEDLCSVGLKASRKWEKGPGQVHVMLKATVTV